MSMREKMARAIYDVSPDYNIFWEHLTTTEPRREQVTKKIEWLDLEMDRQELFFSKADAVLEAMGEPTLGMIQVGELKIMEDVEDPHWMVKDAYKAMIIAAREEGE